MPDPSAEMQQSRAPRRRPILVTLIFLVFLLWAILGWVRFVETLTQPDLILEVTSIGIFWYLLLAGLAWGSVGLPILWGLALGKAWILRYAWIAAVFYPATYWGERLLLWRDPAGQANWPFMLLLTFFWLGMNLLAWRSKVVREFFDQSHQENGVVNENTGT